MVNLSHHLNLRHHLENLAESEARNQGTPDEYIDSYVIGYLAVNLVRALEDIAFLLKHRGSDHAEEIVKRTLTNLGLEINDEGDLEVSK